MEKLSWEHERKGGVRGKRRGKLQLVSSKLCALSVPAVTPLQACIFVIVCDFFGRGCAQGAVSVLAGLGNWP